MGAFRQNAACKRLAAKLELLLPKLDEEGLSFLIEQAEVHLHNMDVIREEERLEREAASGKSDTRKTVGKTAGSARGADTAFSIERSPAGDTYHLVSAGKWKLFTQDEMLALVRIAQGPGTLSEAGRRLYAWFNEERADFILDFGLGEESDGAYSAIAGLLKKKFAVRKT